MDGKARRGDWPGGYWRLDGQGRRIHYIRKMIAGRRYELSTRATTLRGAMEQLARFEADPGAYDPAGTISRDGIYLDVDLAREFLEWSRGRGNSTGYVARLRTYTAWWAEKLDGVDLRRATLRDHILPALEGIPGRGGSYRTAAIKVLYGWLRKVKHEIAAHEDPTFGALRAAPSRPAQLEKSKVIPKKHYLLVREHLTAAVLTKAGIAGDARVYRAAIDVLAPTGAHPVAVERFARSGTVEKYRGGVDGVAGVIALPKEKDGAPHRVAVNAGALAAAKVLLAHGGFDGSRLRRAVKAACKAARIPPHGPGQYRHSVATWAVEAGADLASVSAFLGHTSPVTTRRFYSTHAVPAKVPTLADSLPSSKSIH